MSRTIRVALWTTFAVATLLLTALALIARTQPISTIPSLVLAVGSPYVWLAAFAGVIVAASCRRYLLSMLAVAVVAASLAVQISWYYLGRPADVGAYQDIRVLSSNLRHGQADPTFIVKLATGEADVVTVAELTPGAVNRLQKAGIDAAFPYSHLLPAPGAGGIGIWSRYPLSVLSAPRHRGVSMPAAQLEIPGLRFEPLLASVHVYSPIAGDTNTVAEWRGGMAGAKVQLDNFARTAGPGAVIIGGDYNSTPDMRQFRDLLTNGYRDAVEQSGSGFAPTFPANRKFPPVITIDHVLTRNAAASSVRTIEVPGSDHRAVLTTVQVPLDPTAS
ncbi:endonuclease/exonuclease/phosphatase (EEP) superfamily protein YafD [Mycobacterium sp. BK086]|uniref:endonuclease/exonuclease/phosphatase family protein n=1 Tax=Mycobacterium sp. BK086 TaxID=2512165 RepID=UPI0010E76560|nr:endonuclease/exonuclease/phosphatase family protein [Mycobacterium sp. BK086]TDO08275.1 endonuclease/exonuclease/phosphatase (EEP) superfamily protein YafD [Mycobacterium sp. BK086]